MSISLHDTVHFSPLEARLSAGERCSCDGSVKTGEFLPCLLGRPLRLSGVQGLLCTRGWNDLAGSCVLRTGKAWPAAVWVPWAGGMATRLTSARRAPLLPQHPLATHGQSLGSFVTEAKGL